MKSHHITSHHITSHHITSHHITSHYITLFYITLQENGPRTEGAKKCWARARMILGKDHNFARARRRIKQRVSSDHLPPASAARTTSLARPRLPESSGKLSFLSPASFVLFLSTNLLSQGLRSAFFSWEEEGGRRG